MIHTSTPTRADSPPMMRDPDSGIFEPEGDWMVLHTRSRNEKVLAWELHDYGIPYFLPLVRMRRIYNRRSTEITLPLFAGYVFAACSSAEERYRLQATNRVANLIEVPDQERFRFELDQIRRAVFTPHKVDFFPGIAAGRRCRIVSGALAGVEGVVVMRRETGRVHLEVSMLGQSAVIDLDISQLELLD